MTHFQETERNEITINLVPRARVPVNQRREMRLWP